MRRFGLSRNHPAIAVFAIAAVVSLAIVGARRQGWLERFELAALDHSIGLIAPDEVSPPRVAVVEVSEQDIQNLGSYPVSDDDLANSIEALSNAGARAIGIDIYRDIPVPPGSEKLAAVSAEEIAEFKAREIIAAGKELAVSLSGQFDQLRAILERIKG